MYVLLVRRVIVACLSAFIYAFLFTFINELIQGQSADPSRTMVLRFESIYSIVLLLFITFGLFSSFVFDWVVGLARVEKQSSYLSSLVVYALGGLFVSLLMELIFFKKLELPFLSLLAFGVAPSLVFYHIDLILLKFMPILTKITQK